ncbi:MAG TPA: acetolactate synthase large subunit, partial [Desulfomonilaceae bacterium]|nr:acetolactate synthase large subunit [Desulfomonilaceae bacterium]
MNGAELIIRTAHAAGVELCFANPGTTEMPLVEALDTIPGIRAILCLSEGVCTGAADGYGRISGKPAMTVLHLGPGLANGISNLHNARRGHSPVLNIIGEHATWHRPSDPPLNMNIESLAATVCGWQRTSKSVTDLSSDTADAVTASLRGQVVCLIVPHDLQWTDCADETISKTMTPVESVDEHAIGNAVKLLRSVPKSVILLGGQTLQKRGLQAAARIRSATGCDLFCETLPAHMERGRGIPAVDRLPYFPEQAVAALSAYEAVFLAETPE